MARHSMLSVDFAKSVEMIICMDPVIKDLSPEQLAALHVMKHEVLASLHRLHMSVPAKIADPLIRKCLARLADDFNQGSEAAK